MIFSFFYHVLSIKNTKGNYLFIAEWKEMPCFPMRAALSRGRYHTITPLPLELGTSA